MAGTTFTRNPSPYPPLLFHLLRLGQLLSAIIVSSVVCFFIHYLLLEHIAIPWTFVMLLLVSLLTVLALVSSSALYHFRTLPANYNLTNNAALSIFWLLALSFMTWNLGWTLGHHCTMAMWKNEEGIMVCRMYKACTAFTVTGVLTSVLALFLDIHTQRKVGKYSRMIEPDLKRPIIISPPMPLRYEGYRAQPTEEAGDLGVQNPYKTQESIEVKQFGYSAPTEQTRYDSGHWL